VEATIDSEDTGSGDRHPTIAKATAGITFGGLPQVYDGALPVTVSTVPAGLTVQVTYDGSATPTAPGPHGECHDRRRQPRRLRVGHARHHHDGAGAPRPTINGRLNGSVELLSAENTTLNSGAAVSCSVVPGTPAI
jgi:hypothetical protein